MDDSILVMLPDGAVRLYSATGPGDQPVLADAVLTDYPGCTLGVLEECQTSLPADTPLHPGHTYYITPGAAPDVPVPVAPPRVQRSVTSRDCPRQHPAAYIADVGVSEAGALSLSDVSGSLSSSRVYTAEAAVAAMMAGDRAERAAGNRPASFDLPPLFWGFDSPLASPSIPGSPIHHQRRLHPRRSLELTRGSQSCSHSPVVDGLSSGYPLSMRSAVPKSTRRSSLSRHLRRDIPCARSAPPATTLTDAAAAIALSECSRMFASAALAPGSPSVNDADAAAASPSRRRLRRTTSRRAVADASAAVAAFGSPSWGSGQCSALKEFRAEIGEVSGETGYQTVNRV
ncbi:hypothetical protein CLOP_g23824 [Closterium sp. NIES-67]|nr:hypothetical protein CLOP_g23824 [Closterium sp. NIES-67]